MTFFVICAMVKSRYIGDKLIQPYNGYIKPYYWVDDHPLLYGNNGGLDPGTSIIPIVAHLLFFGGSKAPFFSRNPTRLPHHKQHMSYFNISKPNLR